MSKPQTGVNVLIVEDNLGDARLAAEMLRLVSDITPEVVESLTQALARLDKGGIDLVLLDLSLPDSHGLQTLERMSGYFPRVPIIVLTGLDDEAAALEAVKSGAQDYLVKGHFDEHSLLRAIRYAVERHRGRQALSESEARYHSTLDNMMEGCQIIDFDWRYIYVNEMAVRHGRQSKENLLGRTMMEAYPGIENTEMFDFLRRCMEEREPQLMENEFTYPDGAHGWFELSIQPVPEGVFILSMDITTRKLADAALRESEEKLRLFIEHAPAALAMFDCEMRYLAISRRWVAKHQLREKDLIGRSHYEIFPDIPERWKAAHRLGMQGEVVRDDEDEFILADGTLQWQKWEVRPWYTAGEEIGGIVIFSEDITDQKRAEKALRRYAGRLEAINHLNRVISSSLDANQVYKTLVEEMQRLVGFDRSAIVLLDDAHQHWQIVNQWARGKMIIQAEVWYPVENSAVSWIVAHRQAWLEREIGEEFEWFETRLLRQEGLRSRLLLPLILQDEVIGVLTLASREPGKYSEDDRAVLQPLADQMTIVIHNADLYAQIQRYAGELEQRVAERTAQLEAVNHELEAFTYSASHDLRAPLRHIAGYVEMLVESVGNALDDEQRRYLSVISDSAARMGNLIDDLLEFSRMSRTEVNITQVDFDVLVREIVQELSADVQEREVSWQINPLPAVFGDRALLRQVWLNLISNALKYTRPQARAEITIAWTMLDNENVFSIRDNGVGFNMKYVDRLFGVFQRLHRADQFEGTGIGLAIVERIIKRHGGRVWAEGSVDGGATFLFSLPVDEIRGGEDV
jgi:PAS domain S-box-containing protein